MDQYGDPRSDTDVVDWIESIPFDETRNYVSGDGEPAGLSQPPDKGASKIALENDCVGRRLTESLPWIRIWMRPAAGRLCRYRGAARRLSGKAVKTTPPPYPLLEKSLGFRLLVKRRHCNSNGSSSYAAPATS